MTSTERSSKSSAAAAADGDHLRLWSCVGAVLFVPLALGLFMLTMSSDSASDCALNGEECHPAPPWALFGWSAALAGAAWLTALMASTVRGRQWALSVQVLAEFAAVMVILAHG
jgi:hypothetical protein